MGPGIYGIQTAARGLGQAGTPSPRSPAHISGSSEMRRLAHVVLSDSTGRRPSVTCQTPARGPDSIPFTSDLPIPDLCDFPAFNVEAKSAPFDKPDLNIIDCENFITRFGIYTGILIGPFLATSSYLSHGTKSASNFPFTRILTSSSMWLATRVTSKPVLARTRSRLIAQCENKKG